MFPKDISILVVDDSLSIRNIICDNLDKMGYTKVITAENVYSAQEKLNLIKNSNGQIDLILSDLNMPGPSGLDFLRYIRENEAFKDIPFLLITTESDKSSVLEAALLGVTGYIIKPFSYKTLHLRLTEAWQKITKAEAS